MIVWTIFLNPSCLFTTQEAAETNIIATPEVSYEQSNKMIVMTYRLCV